MSGESGNLQALGGWKPQTKEEAQPVRSANGAEIIVTLAFDQMAYFDTTLDTNQISSVPSDKQGATTDLASSLAVLGKLDESA